MENLPQVAIGLTLPFLGTVLGSSVVFILKKDLNTLVQKILLGFAAGVMIAASVWSLLIPSITMAQEDKSIPVAWLPAAVGFLAGIGFLLLLDAIIPHLHINSDNPEGKLTEWKKSTMLVLAVTLHNIPEGMVVGVVFAGMLSGETEITVNASFALAIGIAIQNFPEGAVISMPIVSAGVPKWKAFLYGALSGIVEPIGAVILIMLTSSIKPLLPYILSFAAGAMIYVVVEELIPDAQSGKHSNIGTIGLAVGFVLMMVLDIAFG